MKFNQTKILLDDNRFDSALASLTKHDYGLAKLVVHITGMSGVDADFE